MRKHHTRRRTFIAAAGTSMLGGLAGCLGVGDSNGEFPSQDIRLIVPYGPDSNTNADAQAYGPAFEDILDVSVEVENIEGGDGMAGLSDLYQSDDGYDIAMGYTPSNQLAWLSEEPGWEFSDLRGVGRYSNYAVGMVANPEYEIESYEDLFDRYQDGEFQNCGGLGLGHTWHAIGVLFREQEGLDWESWVSYDNAGEVVQAVTGDEVSIAFLSEDNAIPPHNEGDIDYLGPLTTEPTEITPDDVQTWSDVSDNDYDYLTSVTSDIYAPPETPDEQIEILEETLEEATQASTVEEYHNDQVQILEFEGADAVDQDIEDVLTEVPEQLPMDEIQQ